MGRKEPGCAELQLNNTKLRIHGVNMKFTKSARKTASYSIRETCTNHFHTQVQPGIPGRETVSACRQHEREFQSSAGSNQELSCAQLPLPEADGCTPG